MKKILMVAPQLDAGGVCEVIKTLCSKLILNYKIDIINLGQISEKNCEYFSSKNVNIFDILGVRKSGYKKFTQNCREIINTGNYDIIHIHTDQLAWIVARVAKKLGVNLIVGHAHGQAFLNYPAVVTKIINKPFQYLNKKYCNALIGCSNESMLHMFGRIGELIYNFVPMNRVTLCSNVERDKIRINVELPNRTILGYAGRLDNIKNAIFIPEIYKNEEMFEYFSLFCGGYYEQTQNKFKEYNLENVAKFLGFRDDVDMLYNVFDIYICPSFSEGMSMSLIQSQMMGIPCVVSSGVPRSNDLGCGLFFQCNTYDTKEWKEKIDMAREVIGNVKLADISRIMKENGTDEDSIIEKIIKIYEQK